MRSGTSAVRILPAGRFIISRDRRWIPIASMRRRSSSWFGQVIQRSDDGGKTWYQPGTPAGEPTTAPTACPKARATSSSTTRLPKPANRSPRISGTTARRIRGSSSASGTSNPRSPIRTRFTPALKTPPCSARPTAAKSWHELPGLRGHGTGAKWAPGAGGMCLHTILLDPNNPEPNVRRHLFGGRLSHRRWRRDLEANQSRPAFALHSRSRLPRSATAFTASPCTPHVPNVLFMQKHWDVMRSDDAGDSWHEISGNLPTDFGFVDRRARPRAGNDLRRADQERLASIIRPTASCASTAAAPAATNGKR